MKKFIALILSVGIGLSLCSCGKNKAPSDGENNNSEKNVTDAYNEVTSEYTTAKTTESSTTTTTTSASTSTSTTVTKSTTEKTKTTRNKTVPTASEGDFDDLLNKYIRWLYFAGQFDVSKLSSYEILEKLIMPFTVGFSLYSVFYDFPRIYFDNSVHPDDPKDPQGRVTDWWCYVKLDVQKVDWILKNVFNAVPDHNYSSERSYYYNGYYYVNSGEGGDGGPEITIKSKELMTDGKYNITFDLDNRDGTRNSMKIVAKPKTVDGKRIWSFYSSTGVI